MNCCWPGPTVHLPVKFHTGTNGRIGSGRTNRRRKGQDKSETQHEHVEEERPSGSRNTRGSGLKDSCAPGAATPEYAGVCAAFPEVPRQSKGNNATSPKQRFRSTASIRLPSAPRKSSWVGPWRSQRVVGRGCPGNIQHRDHRRVFRHPAIALLPVARSIRASE